MQSRMKPELAPWISLAIYASLEITTTAGSLHVFPAESHPCLPFGKLHASEGVAGTSEQFCSRSCRGQRLQARG